MSGENSTLDIQDNDYVSRPEQKSGPVPVQSDDAAVEDPIGADADSDEALARDDNEAIDEDNIVEGRTRGAKPSRGGYQEPGDEEGLPTDDGTSAVAK